MVDAGLEKVASEKLIHVTTTGTKDSKSPHGGALVCRQKWQGVLEP